MVIRRLGNHVPEHMESEFSYGCVYGGDEILQSIPPGQQIETIIKVFHDMFIFEILAIFKLRRSSIIRREQGRLASKYQ